MQPTDSINSTPVIDALIIGAGITGLAVAHALQQTSSHHILVTESQGRVGGRIVTRQGEGFLWEEGPNSFAPTPALLKLAVDVGLKDALVFADSKLPRFVYWQGELLPVPMSPKTAVTSKLLSLPGKFRALLGALGFVPPAMTGEEGEESVAQFFRRHLGQEVLERLVQPFVSGVYAGDPQQLSAQSAFAKISRLADMGGGLVAGALLRTGQLPKQKPDPNIPKTRPGQLGSFQEGLEMLPKAIAQSLGDCVRLNWHLLHLSRTENQTYLAEFETPEGNRQIEAKSVILTTPTYGSAQVLENLHPQISEKLSEIEYPPVACVVLAYPTDAFKIKLQGFGNLIPRGQGVRTLGTIWASTLFSGRTPPGWSLLINFIGGATDREIGNLDNQKIAEIVHQDLCQTLLKKDVPPKVVAVNLWKRAIPQYTKGHKQRLAAIEQALKDLPGVFLCGNYQAGVSLGDCIQGGTECAQQVEKFLKT